MVKFIPRHFIPFLAILNGIVFLPLLSDSSLVYRRATNICISVLYSATLLNPFISYNSFRVFHL